MRFTSADGVRLNIGSSDYATAIYNYNENDGDVEMTKFSVARDDHWVFPMVKEALAVNPVSCDPAEFGAGNR